MTGQPLRVATFNIRHGESSAGRVDGRALRAACAGLRADVLALQEVDVRARRSGFADQVHQVARATGLRGVFAPAVRRRPFRRYGNALLARGRVSDLEVLGLPDGGSGELRVAALARVEVSGLVVSVGATHLSFRPGEGPPQLRLLASRLAELPLPRLLLGDLNLEFGVAEPLLQEAGFELAPVPPAFPASRPRRRIDHVAFAGFEVVRVEAPEVAVSDHRPVVAELLPVT